MEGKGFKVWVMAAGEKDPVTNGLVFETREAAEVWGNGLLMRWTGAVSFEVRPTGEVVI